MNPVAGHSPSSQLPGYPIAVRIPKSPTNQQDLEKLLSIATFFAANNTPFT